MRRRELIHVRNGSNPVLRVFPLHVRLGAASGIASGTVRCRIRGHRDVDHNIRFSERSSSPTACQCAVFLMQNGVSQPGDAD
jgi:hypothetical protein